MEERDLMKLNYEDIFDVVWNARHKIKAYQEKKKYHDASAGIEKLFEDDKWFIAAIHNKGAACELGKETDWCTAAPGLNYFEEYYRPDNPLIFVKNKQTNDRYQLHFATAQFMYENDMPITTADLSKLMVPLLKIKLYGIQRMIAMEIAKRDDTAPEFLEALSHQRDPSIRVRVAMNKNTQYATLARLLYDRNRRVVANARIRLREMGEL